MALSLNDIVAAGPPGLASISPSIEPLPIGGGRPEVAVPGLAVRGCFSGRDTMANVVHAWKACHETGEPCLMVAFGPPEAEALNLSARRECGLAGGAGEVDFGERSYAPGDRVMALRRIGQVRAASAGTVVGTGERSLTVLWDLPAAGAGAGLRSTVGRESASSIGYGYATTPPYLSKRSPGERLFVLGDPTPLSQSRLAALSAWVTVPGPGMPVPFPDKSGSRLRAAAAELATGWPDETMLQRAGPRPLAGASRRRWAQLVTGCALERIYGLGEAVPRPNGPLEPGRDRSREALRELAGLLPAPRLGRGAPGL